jgi:hypothetical protein
MCIEWRQGCALEYVIQVDIMRVFEDDFESSVERVDAVHLHYTPLKFARCLVCGLAPSQDALDCILKPLLRFVGESVMGIVRLLLGVCCRDNAL